MNIPDERARDFRVKVPESWRSPALAVTIVLRTCIRDQYLC